jgi:hypothetical protein
LQPLAVSVISSADRQESTTVTAEWKNKRQLVACFLTPWAPVTPLPVLSGLDIDEQGDRADSAHSGMSIPLGPPAHHKTAQWHGPSARG